MNVAHRPYPLPAGPWFMAQNWHDLLFAHWPVPVERIQAALPPCLPLDTFDGRAWLGIVPFGMSGVRPRGIPPLPGLSRFPEINVRTYVKRDDKPGVFFFSLDVPSRLAVWVARTFFHLPYYQADVRLEPDGAGHRYFCQRSEEVQFQARYRPCSAIYRSEPGSLDEWLTERYCLYTVHEKRVFRGDIHHDPWPLQKAEAEFEINQMCPSFKEHLGAKPLLHFASRLSVVFWPFTRVE